MHSQATAYNRALHRFAVFTALATFLLIIAGALVTSNDAGLSVPDWPTSFGKWPVTYSYIRVPLLGGVLYEHGHRMVAQVIGVLTIILAVWTWRSERRPWMRKLGIAALATVVAQGILGGLTVLKLLPWTISTAHAALGQAFFCIVVSIALFTGRDWISEEPDSTGPAGETPALPTSAKPGQMWGTLRPSLVTLAWLAVAAVYVQLILGAAFRHHGIKLLPHLISAAVVTTLLSLLILRVLKHYAHIDPLRQSASVLMILLMTQLALGFAAYITRVEMGLGSGIALVITTVSHVAVGALLLAATMVLAIQTRRHTSLIKAEGSRKGAEKAIAA